MNTEDGANPDPVVPNRRPVLERIARELRRQTGEPVPPSEVTSLMAGIDMPVEGAPIGAVRATAQLLLPRLQAARDARAEALRMQDHEATERERRRREFGPFSTDEAAARLGITASSFRSTAKRLGHKPAEIQEWTTGRGPYRHDHVAHMWGLGTVEAVGGARAVKAAKAVEAAAVQRSKLPTAWERLVGDEDKEDDEDNGGADDE